MGDAVLIYGMLHIKGTTLNRIVLFRSELYELQYCTCQGSVGDAVLIYGMLHIKGTTLNRTVLFRIEL